MSLKSFDIRSRHEEEDEEGEEELLSPRGDPRAEIPLPVIDRLWDRLEVLTSTLAERDQRQEEEMRRQIERDQRQEEERRRQIERDQRQEEREKWYEEERRRQTELLINLTERLNHMEDSGLNSKAVTAPPDLDHAQPMVSSRSELAPYSGTTSSNVEPDGGRVGLASGIQGSKFPLRRSERIRGRQPPLTRYLDSAEPSLPGLTSEGNRDTACPMSSVELSRGLLEGARERDPGPVGIATRPNDDQGFYPDNSAKVSKGANPSGNPFN